MPDALELLQTRRSIKPHELKGPAAVGGPEIETLLTVASRVPDHGKLAPWRFIVFEGEARRAAGTAIVNAFRIKYPTATPDQAEAERERLARAPLVIAVVSRAAPHMKIPEWSQVLSAGAAAMNLVIAAHALGYARVGSPSGTPTTAPCSTRSACSRTRRSRASFISAGRRACPRIGRGRRSARSRPGSGT